MREPIGEQPHAEWSRLHDAADACVWAMRSREARGLEPVHPADLKGTAACPPLLRAFSVHELERAYEYLVRLGYVE